MHETIELLPRFDRDKNGRLDPDERKEARAWLKDNRPQRGRGPGRRGPDGPGGFGPPPGENAGAVVSPKAARAVAPADVQSYGDRPLFDPDVVRTFFFDFGDADWFDEMSEFHGTDVAIPARVTVDGTVYPDVGVAFRGNTSFMMAGRKKSFDLAFDFVDGKQRLLGVRNLDLLNCNTDPSLMREALHGFVANQFFPAPRVCLARVVVNGEEQGIYAAVQQFDREFLEDHFGTKGGDRFKVPPDFSGNGGLRWLGDDPKAYTRAYELKSKENAIAWTGLVDLCAVLDRTPTDRLEAVLPQHLDVDAALWFLAMDNAVGDDDGYHSRASDYCLWRDPKGRFHPIPRDNNEILLGARGRPGGGPGGPGGPADRVPGGPPFGQGGPGDPAGGPGGRRGPGGPGGAATTPLAMAERADRPLLRRLLEIPAWRERYLANLRVLATTALTAEALAPRLDRWRALIDDVVAHEPHLPTGYEAFTRSFASEDGKPAPRSLLAIVAQRRNTILGDAALRGAWPEVNALETKATLEADGTFTLQIACKAGGTQLAAVRLHAARGELGAWEAQELLDDGRHGDDARDDGVFGGSLTGIEAGSTRRFWIEAVAAESNHVACLPPGNGGRPAVWKAPRLDKKN